MHRVPNHFPRPLAPASSNSTSAPEAAAGTVGASAASGAPATLPERVTTASTVRASAGPAPSAPSERKSLESRKPGTPPVKEGRKLVEATSESGDGEDDFPTVLELLFEQEGDHLPDIDRETVEEMLSRGEWGIAFNVLNAFASKYPQEVTPRGRLLLEAAISLRNAD